MNPVLRCSVFSWLLYILCERVGRTYALSECVFGQIDGESMKSSNENVERFRPLPQNWDFLEQKLTKLARVHQQIGKLEIKSYFSKLCPVKMKWRHTHTHTQRGQSGQFCKKKRTTYLFRQKIYDYHSLPDVNINYELGSLALPGYTDRPSKEQFLNFARPQWIWCYAAVFYGILFRISPATLLQLKIQLETARFEPRTFQVPV